MSTTFIQNGIEFSNQWSFYGSMTRENIIRHLESIFMDNAFHNTMDFISDDIEVEMFGMTPREFAVTLVDDLKEWRECDIEWRIDLA